MRLQLYEIASGQIIHTFEHGYLDASFSPSGWRLASSCFTEGSILIWDIPTLLRAASPWPAAPNLAALWSDLTDPSATRAHQALWRLVSLKETDEYLIRHLPPVEAIHADRLHTLVASLGSADFATREKAEHAVTEAREAAAEALAEAYYKAADLELRRRLERLLTSIQPRAPVRLREARAVLVLEARGTPAARKLLARLAAGVPGARLTQEAKAALKRLDTGR
jgi:hypothetical protein